MPRVARLGRKLQLDQDIKSSSIPNTDVKIFYYSQTLDHFNYQPESYTTFKQKYMIYSKHWGGAKNNSPIFVYLGDEQPMEDDEIDSLILPDYAAQLKALVVIIEVIRLVMVYFAAYRHKFFHPLSNRSRCHIYFVGNP